MNKKPHSKLWLYFAGLVFATIAAVFLLVTVLWVILYKFQVISVDPHSRHVPILVFLAGSLLIGSAVAVYVGRLIKLHECGATRFKKEFKVRTVMTGGFKPYSCF